MDLIKYSKGGFTITMNYKRKTLHRIRMKINNLGICEEPEEGHQEREY